MGQRFPRIRIRNRELTNWSDSLVLDNHAISNSFTPYFCPTIREWKYGFFITRSVPESA